MSPWRISRCSPERTATLQAFVERTFRETYTAYNTPEDMAKYVRESFATEHIRAELNDSETLYLAMENDETIVGYAKLKHAEPKDIRLPTAPNLELCRFYIDQPYHGQGLAQILMSACLEAVRGEGAHGLWLGVWSQNARAIKYYQKEGFTKVGTQIFVLGEDPQVDDVLYRPVDPAPSPTHG